VWKECSSRGIITIAITRAIIMVMRRDGLIPDGNQNSKEIREPAANPGGFSFLE
jgi:hypothetical protein